MVKVEPVTIVYAKLENRPGTLEYATRLLGKRKLMVDALALETVGSTGFLRVHTDKPDDAMNALREGGVEAHASDALITSLATKPTDLGRMAGEIAAAGLNVEAMLTMPDNRLVIRTNDNERAAAILKKL